MPAASFKWLNLFLFVECFGHILKLLPGFSFLRTLLFVRHSSIKNYVKIIFRKFYSHSLVEVLNKGVKLLLALSIKRIILALYD